MHLTMRRIPHALVALFAVGLIAVPIAHAKSDELIAGDYDGKGQGVKAAVTVDELGDGEIGFSLKASCGKVRGSLELDAAPNGALKGRKDKGSKSTVVRVSPAASNALRGTVRYSRDPGKNDDGCKAKRSFTAELDAEGSDAVKELAGHYSGEGDDGGLPIDFTVAYDRAAGGLAIRNMSFQTDTECWNDLDGDGEDDNLVAKVSGLSGEVDPDGSFEIDYMPDDDNEFYVDGTIEDGEAELYVEVGGYFALDGTPQIGGPHECDSWGEDYFATKNG